MHHVEVDTSRVKPWGVEWGLTEVGDECDECQGHGTYSEQPNEPCHVCSGRGKFWRPVMEFDTIMGKGYAESCEACGGSVSYYKAHHGRTYARCDQCYSDANHYWHIAINDQQWLRGELQQESVLREGTEWQTAPINPDRIYFCDTEEHLYERGPVCYLCNGHGYYTVGDEDCPCWRCNGYGHMRRRVEEVPTIMGPEYQEVCETCGREPKTITQGGYDYTICNDCGHDANMSWWGSREWQDEELGVRDWLEAEDDDDWDDGL